MHLNVVTTLRCNLRCAHCIYACPATGDVDPDILLGLVEALRPRGLGSVTFTGGEPGLHPDFEGMVDGVALRGLAFGVATNGWEPRLYEDAVRRNATHFSSFHVSLDGLEATHDRQRGRGSFARVSAAVETWRSSAWPVRVNLLLHDGNAGEADDAVGWCAAAGVGEVKLAGLIPVKGAPELTLSPDVRLAAWRGAPELEGKHGIRVTVASSLLTDPVVPFCPVLTGTVLTLDEQSRVTWCCDAPGSVLGYGHAPVEAFLARRERVTNEMTLDRLLKVRDGALAMADRTCAYCHGFFA